MPDAVQSVSAEAEAVCPFSIAQDYALDFLVVAAAGGAESDIRVPLRFLPVSLHHKVLLKFAVHEDDADAGRPHKEIRLRWSAGSPMLPNFCGTVRFRIHAANTRVLVAGSYTAPFATAGRIFDAVIGRTVAVAGVTDLARRIAMYLETRQTAWRLGVMTQLLAK